MIFMVITPKSCTFVFWLSTKKISVYDQTSQDEDLSLHPGPFPSSGPSELSHKIQTMQLNRDRCLEYLEYNQRNSEFVEKTR